MRLLGGLEAQAEGRGVNEGTRSSLPVPPPKVNQSGFCVYCGRPTKRFVLNAWVCGYHSDLPGKEAL